MANPEHLQILKHGVKAWNQWREQHTDIRPDLSGADLFRADISRANLPGAGLHGANLPHVVLEWTVFGMTYLIMVQGLETCCHDGPSILDHSTLALSGLLPLAFLRGCGLPDALIDY